MNRPLRGVVVGCGGITGAWFPPLKKIDGLSIVGLVDLHEAAAIRRKKEHQLDSAVTGTDVEAMLAATKPDIVFDCTIPDARASVVSTALKHGCHVLSEKPMAASMEQARDLVAAAQTAGRFFAIMQNRRYDYRIRALRQFLDAKALGDLTTLNSDFYLGPHFGGFREQMKHVLLLDMSIHSFDQARLISGADPVSVYCHEWNPPGSWYSHGASAIAIFEMTGGIIYTYRGSWCASGIGTSWECDWRAIGTKGMVTWDGADAFNAHRVKNNEGFFPATEEVAVPLPASVQPDGHGDCIRNFIDCVRTGRAPETVCTENIKSLAMVFGAVESAETGRRVAIKI
jgi:predicted dehydrogenase